jgi:hypothetical protein
MLAHEGGDFGSETPSFVVEDGADQIAFDNRGQQIIDQMADGRVARGRLAAQEPDDLGLDLDRHGLVRARPAGDGVGHLLDVVAQSSRRSPADAVGAEGLFQQSNQEAASAGMWS